MINKLVSILVLLVILLSCKGTKSINSVKISCTKVILQDTLDNPYIHFIVKFQNPNNFPITVYTNPVYKKTDLKEFKRAGLFLQMDNKPIFLGVLHSNNYFIIKPKSELKLPYTYIGDLYKDSIKKDKSLSWKDELKKISFGYLYNKKVIDNLYSEKKININDVQSVNVDINSIGLEKTDFVFNKEVTIEDLIKETNTDRLK